MSAMAKLSACIFSPFIDPEQSARMKQCRGRRAMPPPGITAETAGGVSLKIADPPIVRPTTARSPGTRPDRRALS